MKEPIHITYYKNLFLTKRFFHIGIGVITLFVLSYLVPILLFCAKIALSIFILLFILDYILLFRSPKIKIKRKLPERFSNGDKNKVTISIKNNTQLDLFIELIDELPFQFQKRDFEHKTFIEAQNKYSFSYELTPKERGEYHFGKVHSYLSTKLGLIQKRASFDQETMVKTYPSFIQLQKYDFLAIHNQLQNYGVKKIRRIGHSLEFEQIKDYVIGDDIKNINWKATAKRNQLMVNQFDDEKSQAVYSVIDKGRLMKMPFEGLSLLDYAINASLVISNVVLKRNDKAGLFTFSKKLEDYVSAERRNSQMKRILEGLYNVKTDFAESDFGKLYGSIRRSITHRSLLLLYTNFDSIDALNRQLTYLRAINKLHVLVVVFFENTEIKQLAEQPAIGEKKVFDKIIAEKLEFDKKLIVNELKKYGIHTILTTPKELTINSINKYLEIKAKGLI